MKKILYFLGHGFPADCQAVTRRVAFSLFFLGAGILIAEPSGGASNFETTGSLRTSRVQQTATLLPTGDVLVVGGLGATAAPLGNAELYSPASGTWTTTGSLTTARSDHTATLLPNGKVLVAGGTAFAGGHYFSLASAELYDPATGRWTATGSLASALYNHTATLLPNGKVLTAGGNGGFLPTAELYNPLTGTWTLTGSPADARNDHTATLLLNGKVLVAGGYSGGALASTELYDPASGVWTVSGSLVDGREYHTATLLSNGRVLVAGGGGVTSTLSGAEQYDPVSGIWLPSGSLDTARYAHTETVLPNGRVLLEAGSSGGGSVASAELYTGQVTLPTLLNTSTRMRVLTDDKVLIGGFIITGTELKRVLIRGIGPSLNGVSGILANPTLELHQGSATIATNDNWKMRPDGSSQQGDIEATTISPTNDLESAILVMLSPGAYTAILSGKNGGTGVGLVEVYDLGQGANSRPANISTRGFVDAGDNVMIGGLIVGGGSGGGITRVMVRALGPSIPVGDALSNPRLELHDGDGALIASNDNWRSDQEAEIIATGIPPSNDLESAIVRNLSPGSYTAIVRGVNNTTGIALVEVYDLN